MAGRKTHGRSICLDRASLVFVGVLISLGTFGAQNDLDEVKRRHWAFQPVKHPSLPAVSNQQWCENPIDRFVLAGLEQEQLAPSAPADKAVLVRRAYYDLLGLPPTRDEIESFVSDGRPDAWVRLVDGLLARPQYGERWGRHWLDVARYADTKGYVDGGETRYAFAYTYRDYVIQAFNDDLPYNRFLMEQLAADQLEQSGNDVSLAALGFLTVGHRFNLFPHEVLDDRIDVVGRGMMGLTVTCARCHDHKYDPISMADYYGWYGVFDNSREPSPDQWPLLRGARLDAESAKKVEESAGALHALVAKLHGQIQMEMRALAKDYLVYIVQTLEEHRTQPQPPLRTERGLLREATAYGRGGVARWREHIAQAGLDDPVFGLWNRLAKMTREEVAKQGPDIARELAEVGLMNELLAKAVAQNPPNTLLAVAQLCGALLEETEARWQELLKTDPKVIHFPDSAREQLRGVLYAPGTPPMVSVDESEDLYQLNEHMDVRARYAAVEKVFLNEATLPRAMVVADRENLHDPHIFVRGDPSRQGPRVVRRFLRLFSEVNDQPFQRGSGRLELAQAIVNPANPLTARVWVNRVWGWHFGEGLVRTLSDFGTRSEPPSHPELLDFLAGWFVEQNWSTKRLHRLILSSRTYQQASLDQPAFRLHDPDNRLLWRMNRRRLDFEAMRDSLLAVAGQLDTSAGGKPEMQGFDDPACHKRTIYLYLDREHLPSLLRVFDFPSPDLTSPERPRTTVPQQTLFWLNNRFVMAQAEVLARRLEAGHLSRAGEGVNALHQWILGREATSEDLAAAREFLQAPELDVASSRPAGNTSSEAPQASSSLSLWAQYAQALLQSNEFQFVD